MMTEEEKKERKREYYRKYYQAHKEQRKDTAREHYYISKGMTEEEARQKRNEKAREYYRKAHPKFSYRAEIKDLKEKYKGFKFEYDGTILSFEIALPFRIMVEEYGVKHCDDKEYGRLQNIIRRRIKAIDPSENIVILACGYLQVFLKNMDKVEEICQECRVFVKEQLAIYGPYVKRGRQVGEHFE